MSTEPRQIPPTPQPPPFEQRVLRRSRTDRVIGGVCGGLGRYLGVDPLLLRIAAVALALSGGTGILLYLVAWIAIPEERHGEEHLAANLPRVEPSTVAVVVGGVLVTVGVLLLLARLVPWLGAGLIWPALVVAAGVLILMSARS